MLELLLKKMGIDTETMESYGAKKDFCDDSVEYYTIGCGWAGKWNNCIPYLIIKKKDVKRIKKLKVLKVLNAYRKVLKYVGYEDLRKARFNFHEIYFIEKMLGAEISDEIKKYFEQLRKTSDRKRFLNKVIK